MIRGLFHFKTFRFLKWLAINLALIKLISHGMNGFNTIGQKVIEGTLAGTDTTNDSSNLIPGIYFIKLGDAVIKFVKE